MIVINDDERIFSQITKLDLRRCPVKKMRGAEKLRSVKTLICYECELDFVPTWIGQLPAIEDLNFSWNKLTEIPEWLVTIPTLLKLCLGGNKGTEENGVHYAVLYLLLSFEFIMVGKRQILLRESFKMHRFLWLCKDRF